MNYSSGISVKSAFLKNYLSENKLSEKDFAEIIGVARSTVNRVLSGKRNPGSKFIAGVLANFHDLSFDQVFSYVGELPKGKKEVV
ncbi:helix-turn-helix domain-containing protein [Sporosarcina soli]|uniref:Helix-turn-helix domain-containing protein n=1 Tax=Sporosarcina soli TaxID=334736 RepID=A0ABW0TGD4_9BACL